MNKRLLFTIPSYEYMRASLLAAGDFEVGPIERKIFPDGERYLRLAADSRRRDVVLLGGTPSDLDALVAEAGGTAFVYGVSSGAALALEAAHRNPNIRKLALFEAPFIIDDSRAPIPGAWFLDCWTSRVTPSRTGASWKPRVRHFNRRLLPAWEMTK